MTCIVCKTREQRPGGKTCYECVHTVAKNGSGNARAWSDFEDNNRNQAAIEKNKRLSQARVKLARLEGRAT